MNNKKYKYMSLCLSFIIFYCIYENIHSSVLSRLYFKIIKRINILFSYCHIVCLFYRLIYFIYYGVSKYVYHIYILKKKGKGFGHHIIS